MQMHNCVCGKFPFRVRGAHNTVSQMITFHTCSRAFESSLILNVFELDQNPDYVPDYYHNVLGELRMVIYHLLSKFSDVEPRLDLVSNQESPRPS